MATKIREKHDGALTRRVDVRLWLRLLSCSTIIEKRLRRRFAEQFGTTLPRFDILATLDRHSDSLRMSELSRSLLVSNGNVTAVVRQLEADGYLTIRTAPDDRRSSLVSMTPAGHRHFQELAAAHHGWIKGMFEGMDRNQQLALFHLLDQLRQSIGTEASDEA